MRDWWSFAYRNPTHVTKHAREQNSVRRAMAKHRRENPECALLGPVVHDLINRGILIEPKVIKRELKKIRKIAVHHKRSASTAPHLAADPDNLISLCSKHVHLVFGHLGDYKTRNMKNIDHVIAVLHREVEVEFNIKPRHPVSEAPA